MNVKLLSLIQSGKLLPALTIVFMLLLSSACDNNSSSKKSFSIPVKTQAYEEETTLKGKVSNKKGTLTAGEIKVTNSKGKLIASTQLQNSSHYSVKVPAGTKLPLILTFYPNDGDNKEKLVSVAVSKVISKYEINEFTTLIAKKAKALGGYTHSHLALAAESTVGVPDANKTSSGFKGDPTKQYGGWH